MIKRLLLLLLACIVLVSCSPLKATPSEYDREGWLLIWQDEFSDETLDLTLWDVEIGGHGWGNNESQFYTDRTENIRLEEGMLIIEARDEFFVRRNYTSGRIKMKAQYAFTYGRVEARMKLPYGQGIWPAFWMLGEDIDSAGWPLCGEIDIMEHIGREPNHIYGTVHGPGYSGASGVGHYTTFTDSTLTEDFHVYAIEWEPEVIRWYVDDALFFTITPQQVLGEWVFDHPFFLILNLAVGGNWPGAADETTSFPQLFSIDYVRVYQRPEQAAAYQPIMGGNMHVKDLQIETIAVDNAWQTLVTIYVIDENGQPVADAQVDGGWVGTAYKGETNGTTDETGKLTLATDHDAPLSKITFCVNSVSSKGYTYDKSANARNCATIEN